jgi:hypothetical protein
MPSLLFEQFTSRPTESTNAAPIIIDEQFSIFFMERPGRERVE